MLYEDASYSIYSEIDKTFPYLDELDNKIDQLKQIIESKKLLEKSPEVIQKKQFNIFKIFSLQKSKKIECKKIIKNQKKLRTKTLKHHNFYKDGYDFHIRIVNRFEDDPNTTDYYEFTVSIKYKDMEKKNQFYKKIDTKEEAIKYYKDMEGVFKHLKRRDLIERLFKEKQSEIEYYENQC